MSNLPARNVSSFDNTVRLPLDREMRNDPDAPLDEGTLIRALETNLTRLQALGASADARAGLTLTTNIAMMGSLAAASSAAFRSGNVPAMIAAICVLAFGLNVASLWFVAQVTVPRGRGKARESLLFFGAIIGRTRETYAAAMRAQTVAGMLNDLTSQTFTVANIVETKFTHLRGALTLMYFALPVWVVAIFLVYRPFGLRL